MPTQAERTVEARGGAARYRTLRVGKDRYLIAITRRPGPKGGRTVMLGKLKPGERRDA